MAGRKTVVVEGDASGYASAEVFPPNAFCRGEVTGVDIRLDPVANGASAITAYGVTDGDDLGDQPAQEYIVFATEEVTLTGSATDADLTTMFDHPVDFNDGLRVGGNVTASGDYKIYITVHYRNERRNR